MDKTPEFLSDPFRLHLMFIMFNHKLIIDILHTFQPQNVGSISFALTYYTHDQNRD